MKKKLLFVILFLVVSLGVEAVTRKELTQEGLSKIGIKQEIIDETIKLDEKFAGKSLSSMNKDELETKIKMIEEILEKDDRNLDLNDELFTIYILSDEKKDYEKAKYYLEKSDKYNDKFSSYFNNIVYNRKVGKKKEAEKFYTKLRKEFKDKPLIDLADIFLEVMTGNDEDDSLSVMDENFLENNFYLDNPIENPVISDHPLDNVSKTSEKAPSDDKEDYEEYKKVIKELTKMSIERAKKQKEEIEKIKGIAAYFSNDDKQREFNISDDSVRGFELEFRSQEMSNIRVNEGAEKVVQYYLENVVSDTVSEDAIRFNKDKEEELYFSTMYLMSVIGDEKKIEEYSKRLENARNMKILQKYYGKEESKKTPENTSKGKNKKNSKKKRGK
jgi:hypothetical protein cdivTM_04875